MDVIYFGNFHEVLRALVDNLNVKFVVMEKNKTTPEMLAICTENLIAVRFVEDVKAIEKLEFEPCLCVVASFGIIFSQVVIKKFFKIINIHPGDLFTCRGRHPLPFAILKKLPFMTITAHTIDSGAIDAGSIILMMSAPINYADSYASNEKRLRILFYDFTISLVKILQSGNFFEYAFFSSIKPPYNKKLSQEVLNKIINCNMLENLECEL